MGVGPGDPDLLTVRATRLIAAADVIAYHCAAHGRSIARAAAAPYLRDGQLEEVLRYPVTTEGTDHPGGYAGALADFYAEATERLAAHLAAGRDVVVLCEGDPAFYGSYQHLHTRLSDRFAASIVPGISSVSAAAAAVGVPLVQHDETLTVLPGTLPDDALRARLAGADAVAVLKLGRTFDRVRAALDDTGLLARARYVERAGTDDQRVEPLADVDPATVPYMSLALVPGRGRRARPEAGRGRDRPGRRAGRAGHRGGPGAGRRGLADARGRGGGRRRHRPGRLPALPGPDTRAARPAAARLGQHRGGPPRRAGARPGRGRPPGGRRLLRRPRRVRDGLGRARAGRGRAGPLGRRPGDGAAGRHRRPGRGGQGRGAARATTTA